VVETGGLEKQNRCFAISLKIQLNSFASRKIATIFVFWICSIFDLFAPISVTIGDNRGSLPFLHMSVTHSLFRTPHPAYRSA
jgi:hypothetical protein